jgi:RHH-type rel operon transcriptional repressor/antitoxin RelB
MWERRMLALRLPPDIEKRLSELARKTGRSKSFYAREAILQHLDDLEDAYLIRQRLDANETRIPLDDLMKDFEAEDSA